MLEEQFSLKSGVLGGMAELFIPRFIDYKNAYKGDKFMTKNRMFIFLMILIGAVLSSCKSSTSSTVSGSSLVPPLALQAIDGDGSITLEWQTSNYESYFNGYNVYMATGSNISATANSQQSLASAFSVVTGPTPTIPLKPPVTGQQSFTINGLRNGTVYAFAIRAIGENDSVLSNTSNIVLAAPRPETSVPVILHIYSSDAAKSGLVLNGFKVTDCSSLDFTTYTTTTGGNIIAQGLTVGTESVLLSGINGGSIMDLGYMSDWNQDGSLPTEGYPITGYAVTALIGHVYAVCTQLVPKPKTYGYDCAPNANYGKIQVLDENNPVDGGLGTVIFNAAYQPVSGMNTLSVK